MKGSSSWRGLGGRERALRRRLRRRLAREQRLIGRRLKAAVTLNEAGPVLGRARVFYEVSERSRATVHGGMGLIAELVGSVGLAGEIDSSLDLLAAHRPYWESDHVLNLAYNALCGGRSLDDIELRRGDAVFLDALGAAALPDPTTAGDFCRRFDPDSVMALQEAVNRARLRVWSRQGPEFLAQTARIDADATIVATDAETKEGMDIAYNGRWGYSALVVSLANTAEPLYLGLHGANRPSHEGVVPLYDRAVDLCRQAGFADILLRGDSDYSLTACFDRWDGDGVRFVFGYDARANLIERAEGQPDELYRELVVRTERRIATTARAKPVNVLRSVRRRIGFRGPARRGVRNRKHAHPGLPARQPAPERRSSPANLCKRDDLRRYVLQTHEVIDFGAAGFEGNDSRAFKFRVIDLAQAAFEPVEPPHGRREGFVTGIEAIRDLDQRTPQGAAALDPMHG